MSVDTKPTFAFAKVDDYNLLSARVSTAHADQRPGVTVHFFLAHIHSRLAAGLLLLLSFLSTPLRAQESSGRIEGVVRDSAGRPIEGVSVFLQQANDHRARYSKTNEGGAFLFSELPPGNYSLKLVKSGFRDLADESINLSAKEKKDCRFVMQADTTSSSSSASPSGVSGFQLDDRPSFTVAGISDVSGSGGHAAETRMRAGEVLAKDTLNLGASQPKETSGEKANHISPEAAGSESTLRDAVREHPTGFEPNHQLGSFYFRAQRFREAVTPLLAAYSANPNDHANAMELLDALTNSGQLEAAKDRAKQMIASGTRLSHEDEADFHRKLGDVEEKLGNPLEAVHEYESASRLNPSEENYFVWGSELLLHKAAAPAIEVFGKGAQLHPTSARMLAGLGAALFTSGSMEEAAQKLCQASDLEASNPAPYLFLGKMQEASSTALPCVEQKLARFAEQQPSNTLANYYYGLSIWKSQRGSGNSEAVGRAKSLLEKAANIDPKLDAAFLQLGNIEFAAGSFALAIDAYKKAIAANPEGAEAHYRLGMAYRRTGEEAKAQAEFDLFKQLDKTEAERVDRQRRELGQFLFVLKEPADHSKTSPTPQDR